MSPEDDGKRSFGPPDYPSPMPVDGVTGWETFERVLECGGFESRQRVLVAEPVVEASEAGARTLGVTYWQAVDPFNPRGRPAGRGGGGRSERAARSRSNSDPRAVGRS